MILKLESRHYLYIGKILSSVVLIGIIFVWTAFLIVIVPIILMIQNHGQKGKISSLNLSIFMLPAILCGLLVWRIWNPRFNLDVRQLVNPSKIREVLR